MSSLAISILPRFDASSTVDPQPSEEVSELSAPEPKEDPSAAGEPIPKDMALASLVELINRLRGGIEQVERDALAEARRHLADLAHVLFPKLAEAFLAEEIVQHFADAIPRSVDCAAVRASEAMIERLSCLCAEAAIDLNRVRLEPSEDAPEGYVELLWAEGGASFDFTALLKACRTRLETAL